MTLDELPDELKQAVADELADGETVVWAGRPNPRAYVYNSGSWALVLFGVPWTAFSLLAMAVGMGLALRKANNGGDPCLSLFVLPFVLIGFGMLSAPYWSMREALGTAYLITDRRALIFARGLRSITVRSFRPAQLQNVYRTQYPDESGNLVLNEHFVRDSDGDRRTDRVGFIGIPAVREVERLLRELAAKANPSS